MGPSYKEIKEFVSERLPAKRQLPGKRNQYNTSPKELSLTKDAVEIYNELLAYLKTTELNKIIRTKSGAIAQGPKNRLINSAAYDVVSTAHGARLTIILGPDIYVLKVGKTKQDKTDIYPAQAFELFRDKCEEYGIDLDNYKITNGAEIKKTIPKPIIDMVELHDVNHPGLDNVHHIDFHNSYPAGLCNEYPEFRPVVKYFYDLRRVDEINKAVLNYTIGQFHSLKHGHTAELAPLAKAAITDNNFRILMLSMELELSGRRVIGHNTDGIWYQGDIYHGAGEGTDLGQWENDHTNCKFRAKSAGAYEYIENGKYCAVVRGTLALDSIKPDRDTWSWGDIYSSDVLEYYFDENDFIKIKGE